MRSLLSVAVLFACFAFTPPALAQCGGAFKAQPARSVVLRVVAPVRGVVGRVAARRAARRAARTQRRALRAARRVVVVERVVAPAGQCASCVSAP